MSMSIYGRNPAKEVLNSKKKIFQAFVEKGSNHDLVEDLKKRNILVQMLEKKDINKKFLGNHQGIVLEVEDYKTMDLQSFLSTLDLAKNPLVLMLDGITDPHNLGAIIRSAEAGGVAGIIIPKHRSAPINATVVKVSSGAIEYVNIVEVTNLRNALDTMKKSGFWTVGTDLLATKSHQDIDVSVPLVLVIGSEGKGMSRLLKETVDYNVKIEMAGTINSLNASVSTGILIFDILRKKRS
ncbi:MAG: 23S rRNA (guanosine(2251)-2'-O)-methyltransferase RlmB [Bacilli bacterium]|nr:23S rRNA (guanosine(2251)-2'-O)-methyltransferase RlmB [Bacilli bacterium]MBN2877001.1 23S rRNA (guanosine(2251)-2'-O)-methyltransferase RlmB [Bacilli bacterium]